MSPRSLVKGAACAVMLAGIAIVTPARAQLQLTQAGIDAGFTLSTFAIMDPGNTGFGPFGLAVNSTGTVMVSDYNRNTIYTFNDVDGQTTASALTAHSPGTGTVGMTAVGQFFYGAAPGNGNFGGSFTRYNADGTVNSTLTGLSAYHPYLGMAATPGGHIIATIDAGGLIDIDPAADGGLGSARLITTASTIDGVSVSPDGTKAIAELNGSIAVFDIASGTLLNTYFPGNSPDGTGVISGGAHDGDIIAVGNNGTIVLINATSGALTTIATGGTRGDYSAADPNGTLLLDFSDNIYRLGCQAGCSIGTTVDTPEPMTLALLASGVLGLGAARRYSAWRNSSRSIPGR